MEPFFNGEKAYENILELLKRSTFPNLFDNHPGKPDPVFQIDGNFGATQGMIEMLVQSHNGRIHLLPALPKAWNEGSVKGIKLRGNIELEMSWRDGTLEKAILTPNREGIVKLMYNGHEEMVELSVGNTLLVDGEHWK